MSTSFTRRAALAVAVLVALLAGCSSTPVTPSIQADVTGQPVQVRTDVSAATARRFQMALDALEAGQLQDAEAMLLALTEDEPELAGPWVNLAHIYSSGGQDEAAQAALNHALAANPDHCPARNALGVLLRKQGDFELAEQQYRSCLDANPEFVDAWLNLGILYELYLGRWGEALEAYRLYQQLSSAPDPRVRGWVMDLERRVDA